MPSPQRPPHRRLARAVGALVPALGIALAACTPMSLEDSPSADLTDDRPVVLTTFTVLADIAENVAGEHLRVESITKVGAEVHGYEPTPGDIRTANEADLIVDNGLHLEAWFEQFVAHLDVPHVEVSRGVEVMDISSDDPGASSEAATVPNPHAWMSPLNVQIYVENLVDAFTDLSPEHADDFAAQGAAYSAKLQAAHDDLVAELDTLPENQRALVTCEGAFSYLARDAGLTERYIWSVNAEQQPTPKQITAVIEFVESHEVPAVFCESTVNDSPMQQVVEATDTRFGGTLYVDSLSAPDGPVPTYLDLITHDLRVIVDGLTGVST